MATEATSQAAPEQAPQGQADRTSAETPATPTEKKNATAKADKVNLYEVPEFKNVQRSWQEKLDQSSNQVAQLQRRLNELEDKAAPNDYERLNNQFKRAAADNQALIERIRTMEAQQADEANKRYTLNEIAKKFGVSAADLEGAGNTMEAVNLAFDLSQKRTAESAKEQETAQAERKAANRPDIGGGKVQTSDDRYQKALDDAIARKDSRLYTRLLLKGSID